MCDSSFDDYPQTLDSNQVAELLGHPRKQIEVWARAGTIPAVKDRWFWAFDRDDLIDWIRQNVGSTVAWRTYLRPSAVLAVS